jgi:hypothetical protein
MELILRFDDSSDSFCCGVELGRIISKIDSNNNYIDNNGFPIKLSNLNMIRKYCIINKYIPYFGAIYFEEWIDFIAIKSTISKN